MRRFLSIFTGFSLALAGFAHAGCSSDDATGAAGDGGASEAGATPAADGGAPDAAVQHAAPVSREQFQGALAGAFCDDEEACCRAAGIAYDRTRCLAAVGTDGGTGGVQVAPAGLNVADQSLTYDPQAAGDCIAALSLLGAECNIPSSADPLAVARAQAAAGANATGSAIACWQMLSGTKNVGDPCTPGECALSTKPNAFTVCDTVKLDDGGTAPTSYCREFQLVDTVGAPCDSDLSRGTTVRACSAVAGANLDALADLDAYYAAVLFCDATDHVCKRFADEVAKQGQSCATLPCEPPSYCDATKTCAAPLAAGATCSGSSSCGPGASCANGICTALKADGQACTGSDECIGDCGTGGKCIPRTARIANAKACGG